MSNDKAAAKKRDKRDARTKAADIQINNLRTFHGDKFRVSAGNVTMPLELLRERLGFAYSNGELDTSARVEAALKDRS